MLATIFTSIPGASLVVGALAAISGWLVRRTLLAIDTLRLAGATAGEYAATFRTPVLFGGCVSMAAALADRHLTLLPPLARLAAVTAVAAVVLLGLVRLSGGRFLKSYFGTLVETASLSGTARKLLNI